MESGLVYTFIFLGSIAFFVFMRVLKDSVDYNKETEEFFYSILETVEFIVEEFDIKNRQLIRLVELSYLALYIVEHTKGLDNLYDKKNQIELITLELCSKNGIKLEDDLVIQVLDRVVDYIIANEMNQLFLERGHI